MDEIEWLDNMGKPVLIGDREREILVILKKMAEMYEPIRMEVEEMINLRGEDEEFYPRILGAYGMLTHEHTMETVEHEPEADSTHDEDLYCYKCSCDAWLYLRFPNSFEGEECQECKNDIWFWKPGDPGEEDMACTKCGFTITFRKVRRMKKREQPST